MPIDEVEFYRILHLFPVVRSRDYYLDLETANQSASSSAINKEGGQVASAAVSNKDVNASSSDRPGAFWGKLRSAAEKKVGPAEADNFCNTFQQAYKKLVYEDLSLESAKGFLNSTRN